MHSIRNPVHVRRSKIGELAHQAQSARILAEGEIPGVESFYIAPPKFKSPAVSFI